jgi:hypothetical protein
MQQSAKGGNYTVLTHADTIFYTGGMRALPSTAEVVIRSSLS